MHTQTASTQAPRPASGRAMGPLQISEIILHTRHFDIMQGWYSRLFDGLKPAVESEPQRGLKSAPEVTRLCFFRIHFQYPFTQVLGLFEVPEITSGNPRAPGSSSIHCGCGGPGRALQLQPEGSSVCRRVIRGRQAHQLVEAHRLTGIHQQHPGFRKETRTGTGRFDRGCIDGPSPGAEAIWHGQS
jgi:hypothetical protein